MWISCFRWWPAQICDPREVPTNIQNMRHQPGEFPVMFLGSRDYYWIHKGRVFSYQDGDKGSSDSGTKTLAKLFKSGEQFRLFRSQFPLFGCLGEPLTLISCYIVVIHLYWCIIFSKISSSGGQGEICRVEERSRKQRRARYAEDVQETSSL